MVEYQGARLTIRYCEQPDEEQDCREAWSPPSWLEAIDGIPEQKRKNVIAQLIARRKTLADNASLRSPDYWNTEGLLPNGKHFYAIKSGALRGYGWFSDKHKSVFYISHFALKKGQKLSKKDARRVKQNWLHIEG